MKVRPCAAVLPRCFQFADALRRPSDPEATRLIHSAPPRGYNSRAGHSRREEIVCANETGDADADSGGRVRAHIGATDTAPNDELSRSARRPVNLFSPTNERLVRKTTSMSEATSFLTAGAGPRPSGPWRADDPPPYDLGIGTFH
jgi:hypothetical protein